MFTHPINIKRFFATVILLLVTAGLFAEPGNNWNKQLSETISARLAAQMQHNRDNTSKGLSHQNSYVVQISERKNAPMWVDERGEEKYQIFTVDQIKEFDAILKEVNGHQKLIDESAALYVVVINNWKVYQEKVLSEEEFGDITNLAKVKENVTESSFNDLNKKIKELPATVETEISGSDNRKKIHVYMYANFHMYASPTSESYKTFTCTTHPEGEAGAKMKGIKSGLKKADLIRENIKIFKEYYVEGKVDESIPLVKETFEPTGIDFNKISFDVLEQKMQSSASSAASTLDGIIAGYSSASLYADQFIHIVNSDLLQSNKDNFLIIEHKLQYLKEITGEEIYVVFENTPFIMKPEQGLRNTYAQMVYENSKSLSSRKATVITIPYVEVNKYISQPNNPHQYVMPGIYSNSLENSAIQEVFAKAPYSSCYLLVNNVYQKIKKPRIRYYVFLDIDGSIDFQVEEDNSLLPDRNCIASVHFLKKPQHEEYQQLLRSRPQEYVIYHENLQVDPLYEYKLFEHEFEKIRLQEEAMQSTWDETSARYPFKEKYINDYYKSYALEIAFEENGLKNWWTASEIVWSDPADSEDYKKDLDNACYGLGKLVSVDPVIYTAIDIASIIPKVDNIADAAGLAYATYRFDEENAQNYAIGLSIPTVGAVFIKYGKKIVKVMYRGGVYLYDGAKYIKLTNSDLTQEAIAKIFKLHNGDAIGAASKKFLQESGDDFTSLVKQKKVSAKDIKFIKEGADEAERLLRLQAVHRFTKEYAQVYAGLSSTLKEAADKLPATTKNNLLNDFKEAGSNFIAKFEGNKGLVDSWKVLSDAGRTGGNNAANALTRNIDALESLTKLRSNPKLSKLGITDSHLGNMLKGGGWSGTPDVPSYKQLCDEVDELVKVLPENQGSNFSDFLGSKGFGIAGDAANTRRHSYVQLKRLLESKSILSQADEVVFERRIVNSINGKSYESFSDVYVKVGNRIIEIETKAGMEFFTNAAGSGSNFAKQSFNSLKNIGDVENYKVFLNDVVRNGLDNTADKLKVIQAWKNFEGGALLKDSNIQSLFTRYGTKKGYDFTFNTVEDFLRDTDDWFFDIFKNNIK